jgi:serine/threonine-protein kinase
MAARTIWSRFGAFGSPSGLEDADAFLRARVRIFAATGFWFPLGFWIYWVAYHFAVGDAGALTTPSDFAQLAVAAACGGCWLALRGPRTTTFVRAIEAGIVLGLAACFAALVATSAPVNQEELVIAWTNATSMTLLLRSVLVPSTALRSFVLGALSLGAMLLASLTVTVAPVFREWDMTPWNYVVIWGGAFLAMTVLTSRVIYGLQARVREALELGQYKLLEKIGEGGMGTVYRAEHRLLKRRTAVKLLLPDRAGFNAVERFEREVKETSRLQHPNTVAIYDYGHSPDGVFYYAMEYLEGLDLEELVTLEGAQPPGRVVHLLAQAAHSLAEAHAAGLVHRDVKPANLIITDRAGVPDMLKVVDFGLVKDVSADAGPQVSRANSILGTPMYMAPEAISAPNTLDARADLYALGAVGYFLLTGEPVFDGDSIVAICAHQLHTEPTPPSKRLGRAVPSDLEAVILRCLAKSPGDRYASADELREALLACECARAWSGTEARAWWIDRVSVVSRLRESKVASIKDNSRGQLTAALDRTADSEAALARTVDASDPGVADASRR